MPQRFLRPGIRTSRRLSSCSSDSARWFYTLVLTLVDDFGRYEADPVRLKHEAYPLRDDLRTEQIRRWLTEFDRYQLAIFYKVDGKEYLALTQWEERARYPSRYPAPPDRPKAEALGCKMCLDGKDNHSCLQDNSSPQQTSSSSPKPDAYSQTPKPKPKSMNGSSSTWEIKQQIEAIELKIEDVKARGFEDAFGMQFDDPEDKRELKRLNKKRKELNDAIADKAFKEMV